jgi:modification target Cys-rich repeat protein
MSEPKGQKINRRDFIQAVSKAALPTIAFLSLGRPGSSAVRSLDGHPQPGKGRSKESTNCENSCEDTCKGACASCTGGCLGTCKGTCELGCGKTCREVCANSCTITSQ